MNVNKADGLEKRVLDPGLGYSFKVTQKPAAGAMPMATHVTAHAADGSQVGYATLHHHGNGTLVPFGVGVEDEHQRRGLASHMYSLAEKHTGLKLAPSPTQTDEGAALWRGNASQQQFGLAKMAIRDIAPGVSIPHAAPNLAWDYTHVLSQAHRDNGYTLHIRKYPATKELEATLFHNGKHAGFSHAEFQGEPENGLRSLAIVHSKVREAHQGKGLGSALYEALMAHAFHVEGVHRVTGDVHSSLASKTHASIAARHGMDYKPVPNTVEDNPHDSEDKEPRSQWQQKPSGAYDQKWAPYSYTIKEELAFSKAEGEAAHDEIERMLMSPDYNERTMALKMAGVTPHHLAFLIAHDPQGSFMNLVMKHPAMNEELLKQIAADPEHVRSWEDVPKHPLVTPDVMDVFARHLPPPNSTLNADDGQPETRRALARHAEAMHALATTSAPTRPETIDAAHQAAGTNSFYRAARDVLPLHPNAPTQTRDRYVNELLDGPSVPTHALQPMPAIIERGLSPDVLNRVVREKSALNTKLVDPLNSERSLWSNTIYHALQSPALDHKVADEIITKAQLGEHPKNWASNWNVAFPRALALNPGLSEDHLIKLMSLPNLNGQHEVLTNVSKNPALGKKGLDFWFDRANQGHEGFGHIATAAMVEHPAFDPATHGQRLLTSQDPWIRELALKHPDKIPLTTAQATAAAKDPDNRVRAAALFHPAVSPEAVQAAAMDTSQPYLAMKALESPKLSAQQIVSVLQARGAPMEDLQAAVNNPNADASVLAQVMRSHADEARGRGFSNPALLDTVAQHPAFNGEVSKAALENPKLIPDSMKSQFTKGLSADDISAVLSDPNGDRRIKASVVANPNHVPAHLETMLAHNDPLLTAAVADSPHATEQQLRRVWGDETSAAWLRVARHPNAPADLLDEAIKKSGDFETRKAALTNQNILLSTIQHAAEHDPEPQLKKGAAKLYTQNVPDQFHKDSVMARLGVPGKLRLIRDLILERQPKTRELHPKQLPPGDWGVGRLPNGNISADKIDEHIASTPATRYNLSFAKWGTALDDKRDTFNGHQRHSHGEQHVLQVNLTNDHVAKLKAAGVWNAYMRMHSATVGNIHPNTDHTLGWARYSGGPRMGGIFVDEVQSDMGRSFVKRAEEEAQKHAEAQWPSERRPMIDTPLSEQEKVANAAKRNKFISDAMKKAHERFGTEEQFQKVHKILFGGRHASEVLGEALLQHFRDKGHHKMPVQWHTSASKMKQLTKLGYLDEGREAPAHMRVGYDQVPKKMGFEPATYGALPTQQVPHHDDEDKGVANLDGQPTWQGKVRKAEDDIESWLVLSGFKKAEDSNLVGVAPDAEILRYMHGHRPQLEAAFAAARFLVGGAETPLNAVRRALWESDGDMTAAALRAYGMEVSPENVAALTAVLELEQTQKAEAPPVPPSADVQAGQGDGQETANAVERAVKSGRVISVQLGGKHSKGSVVARDPESGRTFLLKPGS